MGLFDPLQAAMIGATLEWDIDEVGTEFLQCPYDCSGLQFRGTPLSARWVASPYWHKLGRAHGRLELLASRLHHTHRLRHRYLRPLANQLEGNGA